MKEVCSRFDYMKEVEAYIHVLEEIIDAKSSDASKGMSDEALSILSSLYETKKSMTSLKESLTKHVKEDYHQKGKPKTGWFRSLIEKFKQKMGIKNEESKDDR